MTKWSAAAEGGFAFSRPSESPDGKPTYKHGRLGISSACATIPEVVWLFRLSRG